MHLFKYLQAICVIIISEVNHALLAVSSWLNPSVLSEPPQTFIPLLNSTWLQPAGVTLRRRISIDIIGQKTDNCLALQVSPPAVCDPWQWERVGACRSGHSSSGGQSPVASSVVNPPRRSSGGEEHEGRSGTTESAQPSAPVWTGRNKRSVCFYLNKYKQKRVKINEQKICHITYLAYVGVMTKMVGSEGLATCFWGCLVASDFLICS